MSISYEKKNVTRKEIEDILAIINSKSEEDAKAWMENIQESYTYLNPKIMEYALKYFHNHCQYEWWRCLRWHST